MKTSLVTKRKLRKFLSTQKLTVLATCDAQTLQPESALIAFAEDEQLQIYFQTSKNTRKAKNLEKNPRISMVFGLQQQGMITVQFEGVATKLEKSSEITICRQLFQNKHSPTTEDYFNRPETVIYKATPTWIGYSDYSRKIPQVFEFQKIT